ncbi:MAG: DNA-3-methyladenine glycosylase 2 family protein [Chloroflexota bacterium]
MEVHRIQPRGPFSLVAAREFAGEFPTGIGGGQATATSLAMAFPVEGWQTSSIVELSQPVDDAPITARVEGGGGPTALQRALRSVSLDHDGSGWPAVGQRDPVIGRLQADHRFLRPVCLYSAYEAATSFVIGQRIARTQGARIKAWLEDALGDRLELDGRTFAAFPRPQRLLELREAPGLSAEKIVRLHGLAQAALDGRLDTQRLRSLPPAEALAELRGLRGVGEFTAEGILLRGCGVADELPAGDELSREAAAELHELSLPLDDSTWRDLTDRWRPYRMWAIVLLRVGWGGRQGAPESYRRDPGRTPRSPARER